MKINKKEKLEGLQSCDQLYSSIQPVCIRFTATSYLEVSNPSQTQLPCETKIAEAISDDQTVCNEMLSYLLFEEGIRTKRLSFISTEKLVE